VAFLAIDVVARIALPLVYGTTWMFFAACLELDIIILYHLTKPSITLFYGGETVHAVFEKFKIEMQPRMKEIRFTMKLVRKSPLSIVGGAIIFVFAIIAVIQLREETPI
jgi:hypothetical protein